MKLAYWVLLSSSAFYWEYPPSTFAEVGNILAVIRQASYYGMMAVGMVFVIAQGDIDLSVGSLYNLVTMTLAFACQNGMPVNLVIPLGLFMGALFGFVNGALSILLKIPMIIVTLGTTTIYGGLSLVVGAGSSLVQISQG